ncbi:hypothetical protein A0H81_05209 [Grifola frondosa]|uniref:BTB domain-containing protein n=1 Tax=Grifola frondosa TaxID=5627 RepID=A0A1C7MCY0_GRIFR|nr:hypothetical protein A0H81_05209 [Grifola frondosa]
MLQMPQPSNVDKVDECPSVELMDSAQDWMYVLRWLYNADEFHNMPHPAPFNIVAGALRISHKYEFGVLRRWAIEDLCSRWPLDLATMNNNSFPFAAEAIVLARECDVPQILPSAFYALSIQKWACDGDGGRSHLVLTPQDMRRLVVGKERLHDAHLSIVLDPLAIEDDDSIPNSECARCRAALKVYWRDKMATAAFEPSHMGCWLLRELHRIATTNDDLVVRSICAMCFRRHQDLAWTRFSALRREIPQYFNLV